MTDHNRNILSRRDFARLIAAGQLSCALRLAIAEDPHKPRKRIYIAADDHTDYMWTADEQTYRRVFLATLDHYLRLADQTDDRPSEFQSRWNCDGLLWFREYEQHRDPERVARLVKRIKSGHISIPMTMLVSCYGGTPTEAVLRGLYYGGIVERKYQLRIRIAVAMENQTLPYGLGMLWAGSGIKYSWKGICGCASKMKDHGHPRLHDVYWWVGTDGSRILMKWYSLAPPVRGGIHRNEGPGGYAEARDAEAAVEFVDRNGEFQKRNPHSVIGLFGQGWDDLKTIVRLDDPRRSFPVVAERLTNDSRRVMVSNESDYFEDLESTHGDELPEQACSFGNEWELYTASLAEVSASVKRATEKLRAAEAMATLVSQYLPDFAEDLNELREQAWIAFGLYWEHDWTADGPISRRRRAAWQRKIANHITDYVDTLHDRARVALGQLIDPPSGHRGHSEATPIFVFNPLSWKRTDYVDVPIGSPGDLFADTQKDLAVVDVAAGKLVPSQWIKIDGRDALRFLASDVPPCGYRTFTISDSDDSSDFEGTIILRGDQLISRRQQIRVTDDGSLLFWRAGGIGKSLITNNRVANAFDSATGATTVESSGPVSTTLRIDIDQPLVRTTRITMFESLDRIEIDNTIRENFSDLRTWRYEFNLDSPQTLHEEVGAIVRAATIAEGGDYSDQHSRTDWLTMNHFVTLRDAEAAVTVSNRDCLFFHLGDDPGTPMDPGSSNIQILAGGQVDGPRLGIPGQGGDRLFTQRFALSCWEPEPAEDRTRSMRLAMEHQNPLVHGTVAEGPGRLEAATHAMLAVNSDHVVVWALKPAEGGAGEGTIVRLWNLAGEPSAYRLSMDRPIRRCIKTTHVETDIEPMAVVGGIITETLQPGQMRTLRVLL